ncbi:alpha/beta fold hydrolase [Actinomadura barringtoniae]|uniref:Alpha/beta fold hydrolase n=1 Tax=Actinomadura barringtoniae TaxID=1427535 RepID=A0A939PGF1_9ACTN|nr:alpha/beta fold hydrolase [Actinomadura barringtoniae]MBO2449613.1 alpha/beta fold hydrolase [Actinomadura barringtoniae]
MDRFERGEHEFEQLIGVPAEPGLDRIKASSPDVHATMLETFAGPMTHPELSRQSRELASVAVIAALGGADGKLATHVRGALHQGVGADELRALAEHVAVYAGFPRGLTALEVIDRVLTDAGISQPARLHRVRLNDHETVVAQRGEAGPAVLLSHSLGLDWRMWEPVMDRLAVGRRVFAYDIRGHGSAAGSPTPFTMDQAGDDLIGVMDALGLDQAHVAGLSFGGGIAQTAAVAHPDRFASLTLQATTDFAFTEAFENRGRSGEADGMQAQVVPTLTRWFTGPALATNDWGVRYARERILRFLPQDWAAAWHAFKDLNVQGRLSDFKAPVLVLAGELDASTTPEIMSGIAKAIPGSTYVELPGTPHMQTLEQPGLVADALDTFLPR